MLGSCSEAELAREIYYIVDNLVKEGRISGNPENVRIERKNRVTILPCRRSKDPNSLNLKQLEWAANNGHFWFHSPITSLKVILGRGKFKEMLVSELNRISFIIVLNELNYKDFIKLKNDLVNTANGLGFHVEFSQANSSHNIEVKISAEHPLSAQTVKYFLSGIDKLLQTIV
jgi:hypothetical protein